MNRVLETARQQSGMSLVELWIAYVALGGTGTPSQLEALLAGHTGTASRDYDVVAHALNERFADMGLNQPLVYGTDPGG